MRTIHTKLHCQFLVNYTKKIYMCHVYTIFEVRVKNGRKIEFHFEEFYYIVLKLCYLVTGIIKPIMPTKYFCMSYFFPMCLYLKRICTRGKSKNLSSFEITIFSDNDQRVLVLLFDVIHYASHPLWYYIQP